MLLLDLEKVNATVGPGEAVMNTLIGMGTVFVVLILISIIIFLLKYVPKMFEKKKAEPEAAKQEKPAAKTGSRQEKIKSYLSVSYTHLTLPTTSRV